MKDIDKFYDEIIGEDLKRLLDDEDVSEISLNHNGDVFFKK